RTDGTVHETGGEDLLLARPTFPLEEAARNLAGRVAPLAVLDRQRKEGQMRRLLLRHGRDQHRRLTVLHEHCAVGLPGHAPCLQYQGPARERPLESLQLLSCLFSRVALLPAAR